VTKKPDDLEAVRTIADTLADFDPAEQERIIRWAKERVGLPVGVRPTSQPATGTATPAATSADPATEEGRTTDTPPDIKTFVGKKRPSSDTEFAAVVAYYYRFEAPVPDRKESITKEVLLEACRLAGRERPARPAQTLVNAHSAGVLDKAERGQYTINTVGENLVAITLPTSESTTPTPRRKSSSRKTATPAAPAKKASKGAAKKEAAKGKPSRKKAPPKKSTGTAEKSE
jgi:hypothetical protein